MGFQELQIGSCCPTASLRVPKGSHHLAPKRTCRARGMTGSPGMSVTDPAELLSLGHHVTCPGHIRGHALLPAGRHCLCPGEAAGTAIPPRAPREETHTPTRIHMETACFGGTNRLTMELQGYVAMQPAAEFTLFTISPAKQQPPCSQNPGWTLI